MQVQWNIFLLVRVNSVLPLWNDWELKTIFLSCCTFFNLEEREKGICCFLFVVFWFFFMMMDYIFFYNEHDCTEESLVLVDNLHVCCLAPRTCRFIVFVVQHQKGFLPDINLYNFSAFWLVSSQTSWCSVWKYCPTCCFLGRMCMGIRCPEWEF